MDDLTELTLTQKDVIRQYISKIRGGNLKPLIGPTEMGKLMGFSRPRAYAVLRHLEEEGILEHIKRKGFVLTEEGNDIIKELIHRTKVMETYFHTELGIDLDVAEEDAQNTVLHVSMDLIESLCDKLGQPTSCPHDYSIPHQGENST